MTRLLFILKRREMTSEEDKVLNQKEAPYSPYFKYCVSSGLRNSASFVVDMLNEHGISTKLVEVTDNNDIDREVTLFKPSHVIIEAFWVTPSKFGVLNKLHPKVEWIIRNHSELPFLANEGIAIDWMLDYLKYKNVFLAPNSIKAYEDTRKMVAAAFSPLVADYKVIYLPNYYKIKKNLRAAKPVIRNTLQVGCFGAMRPLKNQLVQAVAAVNYVHTHGMSLDFHINVARIENAGNSVLKSIRSLFSHLDPNKYRLIEHGWLSHDDFLELVATMDIGLQTSFTETFNIVTADFISQGVPMVVSKEIDWLPSYFYCDHTDTDSIETGMDRMLGKFNWCMRARWGLRSLRRYNRDSAEIWTNMFMDWDELYGLTPCDH